MKVLNSKELARNINLYVIPCDTFKTANINIFIPCELNQNYTYQALFEQILKRGTASYPDQKSIEILMQELYGASLFTNVRKYGNKQVISFSMDFVDEQYIQPKQNLFSNAIDFLYELIYKPVTENGLFRHEYVLQEAYNLKQQILSIINDKYEYGKKRLIEEMDPGADFTKCELGSADELDNINPVKLYNIYTETVNNNPIDIFVVGDVDADKISELFMKKFNFSDRQALSAYRPEMIVPHEIRHVDEIMDVKQGKLNIGYRTNICATDSDYYKLLMFNAVFGGTVNSKLFMNVREKASLCYHVSSTVDKFNAILTVCTGIETANYQKAYDIIRKQLDDIVKGDITDFEYEAAVKDFETRAKAVNDSAYSMINFYYSNIMAGINITPEQYIERIKGVKKDDISGIASKIAEDTVYFLKNKGAENV